MEGDEEDLNINPLMVAFKSNRSLLRKVLEQGWTVVVPRASTLDGKPDDQTIRSHVLKPSPYFCGEYVTLDNRPVRFESGRIIPDKSQGGIGVIYEEKRYGEEGHHYQVLFVEKPLTGLSSRPRTNTRRGYVFGFSLAETRELFRTNPSFERVLDDMKEFVNDFNAHYVVIASDQFLELTSAKVDAACRGFAQTVLSLDKSLRAWAMEGHEYELLQVFETFIMGGVGEKIMLALKTTNKPIDDSISKALESLEEKGVEEQLAIPPQHNCDLPAAVATMRALETVKTPSEKLLCLKSVFERIGEAVAEHGRKAFGEDVPVTTDDLIPLLVKVLVHAKEDIVALHSTVQFVKYFQFSMIGVVSELGFHLSTLEATSLFLQQQGSLADAAGLSRSWRQIDVMSQMITPLPLQLSQYSGDGGKSATEDHTQSVRFNAPLGTARNSVEYTVQGVVVGTPPMGSSESPKEKIASESETLIDMGKTSSETLIDMGKTSSETLIDMGKTSKIGATADFRRTSCARSPEKDEAELGDFLGSLQIAGDSVSSTTFGMSRPS